MIMDMIIRIGNGNPGAIGAMANTTRDMKLDSSGALLFLEKIESLSLAGPKIWVAYKDWGGQDTQTFYDGVMSGNKDMLKVVEDYVKLDPQM
jgi:hypothetical protein